ncbi:hypothetical protein PN499_07520 [Kamptonema animale CS-326]|jgi:hypothetical protein|uniref:hypothetical protein n=1 Tax=Kamptonema animale TaxID=92934 RepID=UPI00232A972C|nr:hypothetical protein [Kamptonema animale]MDB9511028.1 hypothetical protein [Kamptonema animale CS-326]
MRKILLVAATGLLAFIVGGCGGGSGGDTASPSPTSGASPPSPAASAPATPGSSPSPTTVAQAFPSPVVTPQTNTAVGATGLIQSTNPDERARQVQSDIAGQNKSNPLKPQPQQVQVPAPAGAAGDPFSVLPPQTIRNSPEAVGVGTPEPPQLQNRQVPNLPTLPQYTNPPQWKPTPAGGAGGAGGTPGIPQLPNQQGTEVGTLPKLPTDTSRPQWRPLPGNRPGQPAPPSLPQAKPTEISGLPKLPVEVSRPQWRPQPPIAARPPSFPPATTREVPNLPKLPVTSPPQAWRDPNPPPPPAARPGPPPPPSTDIAQATEVSGVVRVGNEIFVIVKAASEATSRYVKVGQRIANGQVLIKRVVFRSGQDPVVILEQNGVEVSKTVGEQSPLASKQPG